MLERTAINVRISSNADGTVTLVVFLAHPQGRILVAPAMVNALMWFESDDLIRISLQHRPSRTLAYVQGNRALRALCAGLQLCIASDATSDIGS